MTVKRPRAKIGQVREGVDCECCGGKMDGACPPALHKPPGKCDDQEKEYAGDMNEAYDPAEDDR